MLTIEELLMCINQRMPLQDIGDEVTCYLKDFNSHFMAQQKRIKVIHTLDIIHISAVISHLQSLE